MHNIPTEVIKRTVLQVVQNVEYGNKLDKMTNEQFDAELSRRVQDRLAYANDDEATVSKGQLWYMENCISIACMTKDDRKEYVMSQAKLTWTKEQVEKADSVDELLDLL